MALKEAKQTLTEKIGLPVTVDSVDSDVTSLVNRVSGAVTSVQEAFDSANASGRMNKMMKDVIFNRLKEAGSQVIFSEDPSVFEDGNLEDSVKGGGFFDTDDNLIVINAMDPNVAQTFVHELGHAIDKLLFKDQLGKDPEIKMSYSKNGERYGEAFDFDIKELYGRDSEEKQVKEYIADAFSRFLMDSEKLKQVDPDIYEKIKQLLQKGPM
ncbi:hypothetical protein ER45_029770 (plasmid) [Bacillus mycoides]|nr:hypothetical protein ER45_029770 [Bacillus mycoides]